MKKIILLFVFAGTIIFAQANLSTGFYQKLDSIYCSTPAGFKKIVGEEFKSLRNGKSRYFVSNVQLPGFSPCIFWGTGNNRQFVAHYFESADSTTTIWAFEKLVKYITGFMPSCCSLYLQKGSGANYGWNKTQLFRGKPVQGQKKVDKYQWVELWVCYGKSYWPLDNQQKLFHVTLQLYYNPKIKKFITR